MCCADDYDGDDDDDDDERKVDQAWEVPRRWNYRLIFLLADETSVGFRELRRSVMALNLIVADSKYWLPVHPRHLLLPHQRRPPLQRQRQFPCPDDPMRVEVIPDRERVTKAMDSALPENQPDDRLRRTIGLEIWKSGGLVNSFDQNRILSMQNKILLSTLDGPRPMSRRYGEQICFEILQSTKNRNTTKFQLWLQ